MPGSLGVGDAAHPAARVVDPATGAGRSATVATGSGESTTRQAACSGKRGARLARATAGSAPKGGSRGLKSAPMGVSPDLFFSPLFASEGGKL